MFGFGKNKGILPEVQGYYKGFEPSDDSDIGITELEIMVTKNKVVMLTARTWGDKYEINELNSKDFKKISGKKLQKELGEGNELSNSIYVYEIRGVRFVFLKDQELGISGRIHDLLGTTNLVHEKRFNELEESKNEIKKVYGDDSFPQLAKSYDIITKKPIYN